MTKFYYQNKETLQIGGKKTVRVVSVKGHKGHKTVRHYHNGKHKKTYKKRIPKEHVQLIKQRKFIPGLFKDCYPNA